MWRGWTAEEAEYLRSHYARGQAPAIAAALGRDVSSVYSKAKALGLAKREPHWTEAEDRLLREMVGRWSYAVLMRELGRGRYAIEHRCVTLRIRQPIRRRTAQAFSPVWLSRALGRDQSGRCVRNWIQAGALRAKSVATSSGKRIPKRVMLADLVEFLQTRTDLYDPRVAPVVLDGKPNPLLCYLPRATDPTSAYLTVKQAAQRLGLHVTTLRREIRAGRIPAVHLRGPGISPREWFIPKEAFK